MRRTLPFTLLLLALLLVPTSAASAALRIGFSESRPEMFDSPLFKQLNFKTTRVIVSYDVLTKNDAADDEKARITRYLTAARAQGVDALVSFEHSRGPGEICQMRINRTKKQCVLPSVKEYTRNFKLFRKTFPFVKSYIPWQEVNHVTQPTSRNAKRAAQFTNVAAKNCKGCTILAADILDQADRVNAKRPTFRRVVRYIRTYKRFLRVKRKICGIHNYGDVNRFRTTGTKTIIKALGCKQYWLTETGGIAVFGSFPFDEKRQAKATRYMFKTTRKNKKIKRLYIHTFFGGQGNTRFDAGVVDPTGLKPRPAYNEIRKRI